MKINPLHAIYKLGKKPVRHDPRTLMLANYLKLSALPPLPASVDWFSKVQSYGMMLNDSIGDCTCAAAGHMIEAWTADANTEYVPPDSDILEAYETITGYDPTNPNTDQGANELDVLNYWRQVGISGRKIQSYVALEPGNIDHVKAGIFLFGGVYIGVALPKSAQGQSVWSVPSFWEFGEGRPGSWGGHAVPVLGYDADGLTVVTWGETLRMTWPFWSKYTEEAYAVLSSDWFSPGVRSPSGFDLPTLTADLSDVTN